VWSAVPAYIAVAPHAGDDSWLMAASANASCLLEEVNVDLDQRGHDREQAYNPLTRPRTASREAREGPVSLQLIFRILEARGPKDSLNLLRDILESMKLVQAITGTGAAASFVHANSYSDTRGEAFGILTALSTILAFLALIVTVIVYVSIGLLEHEDMVAVEGYLVRYWSTLAAIVVSSVLSMILLVSAVVVDSFRTYSKLSAICLLSVTCGCFLFTVVFWVSSTRYVFASSLGAGVQDLQEAEAHVEPEYEAKLFAERPVSAREWTETSTNSTLNTDRSSKEFMDVLLCR